MSYKVYCATCSWVLGGRGGGFIFAVYPIDLSQIIDLICNTVFSS